MRRVWYLFAIFMVLVGFSASTKAQSEPFLGQIAWVAFDFAPRGWAKCDGQLLSINENQALYSLLGTNYGGDGRVNFALPDMRGRVPVHAGFGHGLTEKRVGEMGGSETVTLTESQMPAHTHAESAHQHVIADQAQANGTHQCNTNSRRPGDASCTTFEAAAGQTEEATATISSTGGSQPHPNMQPWLALNCIIALEGIFPSRQ